MAKLLLNSNGKVLMDENGKVYITGGYTDDECFCNKVEVFDLATKQTTILPPLPISVNGYLTSSVKDGKLYIFESRLTTNNNNYIYINISADLLSAVGDAF